MKRSVLRALLSGAYGLAWLAARPVLCRHKRLQEGFPQRLVPDGWPGSALGMETGDGSASSHTRSDIWLQAASGGEAYLVWELLAHLAVLCEKQALPSRCVCSPPHGPGKGSTFCRICRENFMRSTRGCPSVRRFSRWTRQNSWRRRSIRSALVWSACWKPNSGPASCWLAKNVMSPC